ncbi:MAG TPA: hypothetical protein VFJ51_13605, partial [Nitrososphaeraceae archaeon]|nr:hypothetical protein [Nitrososphaeraceae archaeon]
DKFPRDFSKSYPFQTYVYYLFSQIFPRIWIGLFEEREVWKNVFKRNGMSNTIDLILPDNGSVPVVECIRQFIANRSIVRQYRSGKLLM